jgi:hypothetical protein
VQRNRRAKESSFASFANFSDKMDVNCVITTAKTFLSSIDKTQIKNNYVYFMTNFDADIILQRMNIRDFKGHKNNQIEFVVIVKFDNASDQIEENANESDMVCNRLS